MTDVKRKDKIKRRRFPLEAPDGECLVQAD
jgi:hypothetical protein